MLGEQLSDATKMAGVGESSDTVVEVNIKTLESQVFSFRVDKNMLVSEFKEKIASKVGLPVGRQRLIFRGKVLKDEHALSEYHVDDGHTLHLVTRQPAEFQAPSVTSPGDGSSNDGQNPNATSLPAPVRRIFLGTLNVREQGEGIFSDISQVLSTVLNSIGLQNQSATSASAPANVMEGPQSTGQFSSPVQVSRGIQVEGTPSNTNTQRQAETRAQTGQAFPSQSLPDLFPHLVPPLNEPAPHSLRTLSEFMSHMERALQLNESQANESQTNSGDEPVYNLPTNARGLPTPEALILVMRQAQHLLTNCIIAALSHTSDVLEQDGSSADTVVRDQIQRESLLLAIAINHAGSLMLELARTISALHIGQSPAEAYVDAGPAVYITSSAPHRVAVQPPPSLFEPYNDALNSENRGPTGNGAVPRQVNIHIVMVPRAVPNADVAQEEQSNHTGSAVVPPQSSVTVPSASPTNIPASQLISLIESEINSLLRNPDMGTGNPAPLDGQEASTDIQDPSSTLVAGNDEANNQLGDSADMGARELNSSLLEDKLDAKEQKESLECSESNNNGISLADSKYVPPSSSNGGCDDLQSGEAVPKLGSSSEYSPVPSQQSDNIERANAVPLGLGLGGLQPKRKSGQLIQGKASDGTTSSASIQNQQMVTIGQQVAQSLASMSNPRNTSNVPLSGRLTSGLWHMIRGGQMGGQVPDVQNDVANAMTRVLHSPAFSNLLSEVSQQTEVGSPNALSCMLEQFTGNPAIMNAVNQFAQQFDSQDVGNMFSGLGSDQGGGLDLAGMVQQMMLNVSQALGGGPTPMLQPLSSTDEANLIPQSNVNSLSKQKNATDLDSQRIENQNPPEEIFCSLVAAAGGLGDGGGDDLANEVCHEEEGLAGEFEEALGDDLPGQLEGKKGPTDRS